MTRLAKHPYKGYKLYKVFHKKEGRYYAVLYKSSTDRTTVAYAKYKAEVRAGKHLGKLVEAHHVDENKTRDKLDNIEVCSFARHGRRHRAKERWMIDALCSVCQQEIYKPYRGCLPRQCKQYLSCSRKCGYVRLKRGTVLHDSKARIIFGPIKKD